MGNPRMAKMSTLRHLVGLGGPDPTPEELLVRVARGDEDAFGTLYDALAPMVFGIIQRVVRNSAQTEEVAQEVFVDLWRAATRYDPARGSALSWATTMAHRRAVDRVRSEQAASDREYRVAAGSTTSPFDEAVEQATANLEHQQVRRCLSSLTELQREAITLAYYAGYTYREVADLLAATLPAVKTRIRDGLVRLRDCLGLETTA